MAIRRRHPFKRNAHGQHSLAGIRHCPADHGTSAPCKQARRNALSARFVQKRPSESAHWHSDRLQHPNVLFTHPHRRADHDGFHSIGFHWFQSFISSFSLSPSFVRVHIGVISKLYQSYTSNAGCFILGRKHSAFLQKAFFTSN